MAAVKRGLEVTVPRLSKYVNSKGKKGEMLKN